MPKDSTHAVVDIQAHFQVEVKGLTEIPSPSPTKGADRPSDSALDRVRSKRTKAIEEEAVKRVKEALAEFGGEVDLLVYISHYDSPENHEDHAR